ncbi:BlaI/MecI/CopY family transcriptional regulator [Tautonia marina]|uniref:BlaI/MecI/CopY family transcriptional regulator n=1 Tax=Tautonia marina TaxID=2653855 RepID=UPI001260D052|nr:BlaI/MecI/CopY family transcriptional regulator [Tautonia marina]
MGAESPRISDAEWEVMEAIWALGPATPAQVIERVAASRGWNHRTVRTLLARLVEKGALQRDEDGARSVYLAAVDRDACVRDEGQNFLARVFAGDAKALLVHFAREAKLDADELQRLKALLDEKTRGEKPKEEGS